MVEDRYAARSIIHYVSTSANCRKSDGGESHLQLHLEQGPPPHPKKVRLGERRARRNSESTSLRSARPILVRLCRDGTEPRSRRRRLAPIIGERRYATAMDRSA